jgi:uncharacterized membrane protein
MTTSEKKHRIIFIDLMRAFAVFQMVQGHTINVVLNDNYRTAEFPVYYVWNFMRGMTAPIFLFSAGVVFTYLFRLVDKPFFENPRVIKGIKRGFLLIFLGYLLRYPTWTVFDFKQVSEESLKTFYTVDVLHLIGLGLFVLLFLLFLSEKIKLNDGYTFGVLSLAVIFLTPFIYTIDWSSILPAPLSGYMSSDNGSLFPLFPWISYILIGGVLGSYLAKNPMVFKSANFSLILGTIGSALILLSMLFDLFSQELGYSNIVYAATPNLVFFRLGFVLVLNSLVSYIALRVETIPRFIILIGRNTLLIYVVHLLILYGSAWNPGISNILGSAFNGWQSLGAALIMLTLMTMLVIIIHFFKIKNKQLVT